MSKNGNKTLSYDNLFSSLISDIKSYNGTDPILPWIRGIRKMKDTLPPEILKEKLPRFLQKCSETFLNDSRYTNDLRYLRVWLQLMDFVDDPKEVLRKMETNQIGMKQSLFYQAYALYYEKMKKFDAAEKIYHLGVQNLAEPATELQKSYGQFLQRMARHQNKRAQGRRTESRPLNHDKVRGKEKSHRGGENQFDADRVKAERVENNKVCSDDTVVVKFVDTAIVGKSNAEDARHHGLVEPTINTKEAMNAINSMFREPLEPSISRRNKSKTDSNVNSGFTVFTDESLENKSASSMQNSSKNPSVPLKAPDNSQPLEEPFEIYVDGEETIDGKEKFNEKDTQATVFAKPNDLPSESCTDPNPRRLFREDTVVYKFVGSTISDETKVENAWHHGLVEPTVNLKEAMDDINSMFGEPIEFVRKSRSKKHVPDVKKNNSGEFLILADDDEDESKKAEGDVSCMSQKELDVSNKCSLGKRDKAPDGMENHSGFLILPDDELDNQQDSSLPSSSYGNGSELFEKTLCTKEAMAEINKLFAMPMDF